MAPPSPPYLPTKPGTALRTKAFFAVCDQTDDFFHIVRASSYCVSARPPADRIKQEGDFAQSWWMKSFFDGTIDLSLQSDNHGCILLNRADADRVRRFANPLRDSLVVVKRDDVFSLKDGFHRLCEALARGYRGRVYAIVVDMDADTDDTEEL